METGRLREIDALRGIAACIIAFVFHQDYLTAHFRQGPLDHWPLFSWLHLRGWTMVDLFFVISGFIMTHVYVAVDRFRGGGSRFAVARMARLYPLHIITLCAVALILAIQSPASNHWAAPDLFHFLLNLAMLQDTAFGGNLSFNAPAWSISVEMVCYGAFFVVVRFGGARLPVFATVLCLLGLLTTVLHSPVEHVARAFAGFFAGVVAYRYRDAIPLWVLVPMAVLPFMLVNAMTLFSRGSFLAVTAFPSLVILAPRVRLLTSGTLKWIGDRSYSIYLIHVPVYWTFSLVLFGGRPVDPNKALVALFASIAVTLALADLSFRHFESPLRRATMAWWDSRSIDEGTAAA